MQEDLGITKRNLELFLTLYGLLYGVSEFANGFIGGRINAHYSVAAELVLSAACNILFGSSSAVPVFGIAWMLNGRFQGMGLPPCARLLTHWIPPMQLAAKVFIWNTSRSIGAGLVVVVCGYIVSPERRWCSRFPSIITLVGAVGLWFILYDTPRSVGLPEFNQKGAGEAEEESSKKFKAFARKHAFGDPAIWVLAFTNLLVYIIHYAVLDWGPTLLGEWKDISIQYTGWMAAVFEISDVLGMLTAGRATDCFFGGRGSRVCALCMTLATVFVALFRGSQEPSMQLATCLLGAAGFCIYGPQILVGIATTNIATKKAAAAAVDFTGLFGYTNTLVLGRGLEPLAQHYGWDVAVDMLILIAVAGTLIFAAAWIIRANGCSEGN